MRLESCIAIIRPRLFGIAHSVSQMGITVVMIPRPKPATRRPTRNWPRVVVLLCMIALFVSGELAITSSGGIWSCCSRDMFREQTS
jgi:hypothetical protein